MAGLWEYVKVDSETRTPSHAIFSACVAYANGDFTKAQILSYLNEQTDGALSSAAETDLNDIATNIDGKNATQVLQYVLVVHAYNMVAETSAILSESQWRTRLEIV